MLIVFNHYYFKQNNNFLTSLHPFQSSNKALRSFLKTKKMCLTLVNEQYTKRLIIYYTFYL